MVKDVGWGSDPMFGECQKPKVRHAWTVEVTSGLHLGGNGETGLTVIAVHLSQNQVPIFEILLKSQCMVKNVYIIVC
jgi:hypothetical protein